MNKIIVLEDNDPLAKGIVYALEKEGWETELASTAKEFKQKFFNTQVEYDESADINDSDKGYHPYDLVILDVMLPDGNGFDICEEIRTVSDVPIIFLTACDAEVNIVLGLDMGADDYITKPFRTRELVSRINAALRRSKNNPGGNKTLISKDISLNLNEMKLLVRNKEITLTPTEYKLMSVFMQNPERVLDRNTILSKLWDVDGQFIDDNTLSVYISRLREKLEQSPEAPEYITTVRGLGYRWKQRSRWV